MCLPPPWGWPGCSAAPAWRSRWRWSGWRTSAWIVRWVWGCSIRTVLAAPTSAGRAGPGTIAIWEVAHGPVERAGPDDALARGARMVAGHRGAADPGRQAAAGRRRALSDRTGPRSYPA